jgi:ubiquinone/menaquinone biosynthesis C-methylase UbiE
MGTNEKRSDLLVKDHSVSGEKFKLVFDSEYQMFVTTPKPGSDEIGRYYESGEYVSHTDSRKTLIEKMYAVVKRYTIRQKEEILRKYKPQKGLVLDIGAGTGDFLVQLKDAGWHVVGVEPNTAARTLANNKGVTVLPEMQQLPFKSVDIITMWHVLEHVPDVDAQFEEINRYLDSKGKVIIAVPNFKSYDASYYREFWAAYDVPRHLTHFSKRSVSLFADKHNFRVQEILPMKFDSFYVSMLSEKYRSGQANLLKAFWIGLRSNMKASKTGEYSSLIYVLTRKN